MIRMQGRSRGLRELCGLLGYTSQAYYQYQTGLRKRIFKEELLIQQVIYHRRLQPRLGARKLLVLLQSFMEIQGIDIGRDVFFELLKANNMLVRRRRTNRPRTTISAHRLKKYPDLTSGLTVYHADALWVSDITYIHLRRNYAYLSLVTDVYSHKIVGFRLSRGLSAEGCIQALEMALSGKMGNEPLIHHSDRGAQYCSAPYVALLNSHTIDISMTQNGDPRDNAIAERVNGILKQELLKEVYPNFNQAKQAVTAAIDTYNRLRPHSSIDMLTPQQAHCRTGEIRRRWKNYYKRIAKEVCMDS